MAKDAQTDDDKTVKGIDFYQFPLARYNFIFMGICGVMIVLGFVLMIGSPNGESFNPDIFSVRRIIVGPTISFLGFVLMAFAIIFNKKK